VVIDRRKFDLDDRAGTESIGRLKQEAQAKNARQYSFEWTQTRSGPALRLVESKGKKSRYLTVAHKKLPNFIKELKEKAKNVKL